MYFLIEAAIALSVSFFINLFVVAVFGQAFYQQTNQAAVRHTPYPRALQALLGTPKRAAKPFESLSCTPGTGRGGSLRPWPLAGSPFPTPLGRHATRRLAVVSPTPGATRHRRPGEVTGGRS